MIEIMVVVEGLFNWDIGFGKQPQWIKTPFRLRFKDIEMPSKAEIEKIAVASIRVTKGWKRRQVRLVEYYQVPVST